jgi:hypothetical protein
METESQTPTRPTKPRTGVTRYDPEFVIQICERIATTPQSLARICAAPDMPCVATLFRWLRDHPDFAPLYNQAKQMQAELLIDQALDIVDDSSNDLLILADGRTVPNTAALARCRQRVEFRKWIAAKLLPRKYGNHSRLSVSADSDFGPSSSASSSKTPRQSDSAEGPEPVERVLTEPMRMQLIELRRQQMEEPAAARQSPNSDLQSANPDLPAPRKYAQRITFGDPYESLMKEAAANRQKSASDHVTATPATPPLAPPKPVRRMYDCPDPAPPRNPRPKFCDGNCT